MAYSTLLTVAEAKVGIDQQMFPPDILKEGDLTWYPAVSYTHLTLPTKRIV